MAGSSIEVDYLVVGAGAAGMAFTDALIDACDATVLMVDRRHAPGGHWNDAYPFVRLHQPSAYYGVNSRVLGSDRVDTGGPNAGFYERATGAEICAYFQVVMRDHLVESGRVEFLPMTACVEEGDRRARLVSQVAGTERDVRVRRKIVDARFLESAIPATHRRGFAVDDGVRCVPVNDLVRSDHPADGFTVLGAGKTAMDACVWLLDNGVDPDEITWIKPRESWVLDRARFQPLDMVADFFVGYAAATEIAATASTKAELFGRLEECGELMRVATDVEPEMYRAAILSPRELAQLRSIERVVRAGHVRRIGSDRVVLAGGDVAARGDRLYVDCTADGLPRSAPRPIFEADRVTVQQLRETSPTFNAALIGYLEATHDDPDALNAITPTNAHPNHADDWIRVRHLGLSSQRAWDAVPDIGAWIEASRLNISAGIARHAGEPRMGEAISTYLEHRDRAIDNLARLRIELGDELPASA